MKISYLTDDTFLDAINREEVALVNFTADWCPSCKAMVPIIERLSLEYQGAISFYKLDVDVNPGSTSAYFIRSIPSFLLFENGNLTDQFVGPISKVNLEQRIKNRLRDFY